MISAMHHLREDAAKAQTPVSGSRVILINFLILSLAVIGLLFFMDSIRNMSLIAVSRVAAIFLLGVVLLICRAAPRGIWSVPSIYLVVFSLFHFGIVVVYGLDISIAPDMQARIAQWFYSFNAKQAIILAVVGLTVCALGVHMAWLLSPNANAAVEKHQDVGYSLAVIGCGLLVLSVCSWFMIVVQAGGFNLLVGSYSMLLAATEGSSLTFVYFGIGLGITFLAAATPSRWRRVGIAAFVTWTLFAFPIGLRGEVLFPACAAAAVAAKRRQLFSWKYVLLLSVALLCMIAFVKELRQVGLQGFAWSEMRVQPLDALVELGSSLRPVTEVVLWHEAGEEFIYGASYWAPFERALYRVIPDVAWSRPAAQNDDRLMNVLVAQRVGPIGFSPVAEAYRNGGTIGVSIVMLLTGLLLGWMDSWPSTHIRQAILGAVFTTLLLQVRNAFTPVPFQIIAGISCVCFAITLGRMMQKGKVHGRSRRA